MGIMMKLDFFFIDFFKMLDYNNFIIFCVFVCMYKLLIDLLNFL